jgi:hypothetical protein
LARPLARFIGAGSAWDTAPRPREIVHLRQYRDSVRMWRAVRADGLTMLNAQRGRALRRLAMDVDRRCIKGAIVDCGVWRGGSTVLLASASPGRHVWAFDAFEPSPAPDTEHAGLRSGYAGQIYAAASAEGVLDAVGRFAPDSNVRIVKGWFDETFPETVASIPSVALLHIDGESYPAVSLCLETFHPRVEPGGYVIVNTYGAWEAVRDATEAFWSKHGNALAAVARTSTAVCWRKAVSSTSAPPLA